jgi:hypothetical protein
MYDLTRDGFVLLAMGFKGSAYCAYPNQRIRGVDRQQDRQEVMYASHQMNRMNTAFFFSLLSGTFMGSDSVVRINPVEAFWCLTQCCLNMSNCRIQDQQLK